MNHLYNEKSGKNLFEFVLLRSVRLRQLNNAKTGCKMIEKAPFDQYEYDALIKFLVLDIITVIMITGLYPNDVLINTH